VPIRYLLFDLDETLYPRQAGVMKNISRLIRQYMVEYLGLAAEEAGELAHRYYLQYGTSMRGLILHNNLDADHFLAYVHDFPLDELTPDGPLGTLLAGLPCEKVIFTNADQGHAERVLDRLQVRQYFSRIIDVTAVDYFSKPNPEAYAKCLELLDASPQECVLIEDSARNLAPAAELGMVTVLVDGDPDAPADYRVDSVLELGPVIAQVCRMRGCRPSTSPHRQDSQTHVAN